MTGDGLEIQRDWDAAVLHGTWPPSPDSRLVYARLAELPVAVTARGASGRVLEVAAAEAVHSCKLNLRGLQSVVLDPSPVMIDVARRRMAEYGARLTFVRGIGERLPFPDATFERVLCESSIDHFAGPDLGVREMMRVCKPEGRVVIGAVNYGSLSVRVSRILYRVWRRLGLVDRDENLFWDTPVPLEHTFECTYRELLRLGHQYGDLEEAIGISLGWATPGWGGFLNRLGPERAASLLQRLDAAARRIPRLADYVLTVWRPRPAVKWTKPADPAMRVRSDDPAYRHKAKTEARFWDRPWFRPAAPPALALFANRSLTGDPDRSWLDDVIARGPFGAAAMLGCDDDDALETAWIRAGASPRLDVYDLSPGVIKRRHARVPRGVRYIQSDLNFVRLPAERYDVIWSSGCLHHIVNLEYLLDQVARALRPGGLFAVHDYIGERLLHFDSRRLVRVNAALHEVPARFRHGGLDTITRDVLVYGRSPFCAVRSDEMLSIARARFRVVHEGFASALFPLAFFIDVEALAREAPDVLDRVLAAEAEALSDPTLRPCEAYVVFRR